jgi:uncharacterized membrane protein SirB2
MISYAIYKILHYLGLFGLFVTLAVALGRAAVLPAETVDPWKRRLAALHGICLLVVLTAGFGLMARIGVMHGDLFPGWIWAKLGIWLILGGIIALASRRSRWTGAAIVALPFLAALAGYLALVKPF